MYRQMSATRHRTRERRRREVGGVGSALLHCSNTMAALELASTVSTASASTSTLVSQNASGQVLIADTKANENATAVACTQHRGSAWE